MRTDLNTPYTVLYYKQHYIQHDRHLMNFICKKSIFILKFRHRSKKTLLLYGTRNEGKLCWAVALSARVCLCVYVCLLCPSWGSASLLKIRLDPSKGGLDAVCSMYACVCVCSERCVWSWADADVLTAILLSVCPPHISLCVSANVHSCLS